MIPIVSGSVLEECLREESPGDIPCYLVTAWTPPSNCSSYNVSFYSENGSSLDTRGMADVGSSGRCNATFNYTAQGQYFMNSSADTWNVLVKGEDDMASLSITFFILAINSLLFIGPFFIRFSENEVYQNIFKKMMWIGGFLLLSYNTTLLVVIAENAGIAVKDELFFYQKYFLWGIYVTMFFLFWNMIVTSLSTYRVQKRKKLMGEE